MNTSHPRNYCSLEFESPFIHCDETENQHSGRWSLRVGPTDGLRVVFRLTDTREIPSIRQLLSSYHGVLISDFYAGYDSVACKQQKCLVHLIRTNDDLWKNPFDEVYADFVGKVSDVLVPIFEDVGKYRLKARFLRKHMKAVYLFYSAASRDGMPLGLVETYRKRFKRYRESLFLFLNEDGIPWNNNMAERALRHLSVQQKISGCFVERGASDYLRLLGISQSCRFQDKPLLQFLLSRERDVDKFRVRKRHRTVV